MLGKQATVQREGKNRCLDIKVGELDEMGEGART